MKIDIEEKVKHILNRCFEIEDIETVPDLDDSRLNYENKGLRFEATVLYVLIKNTEKILLNYDEVMLAKFRRIYFYVVVEIVESLGGTIRRAHDNGLYVFFQGTTQDSLNRAVKAAMKIKYMLTNEYSKVRKMLEIYDVLDFAIGIDDGQVLCTKVDSDNMQQDKLIWSGCSLNRAMKIAKKLKVPEHIGVSELVHYNLNDSVKYTKVKGQTKKQEIWNVNCFDNQADEQKYYSTSFFWTVS